MLIGNSVVRRKQKNAADVNVNDKSLNTFLFIKINSDPATREQATSKHYVDQSIDEATLVRCSKRNDFNNHLEQYTTKRSNFRNN